MIVKGKSSAVDGATICGEVFCPADGDSAHAVFERGGRSCGISYEMGSGRPYLRCAPGVMLPPGARSSGAWNQAAWAEDDDRLLEVRLDEDDGELVYCYTGPALREDPESCVKEALEFLLGDEFHEFVVRFVARQLGVGGAA
jgi:hypothetical protein